jgi:hypothetical protein
MAILSADRSTLTVASRFTTLFGVLGATARPGIAYSGQSISRVVTSRGPLAPWSSKRTQTVASPSA